MSNKIIVPSEDREQEVFVSWVKLTHKDFLIFSIPNGGSRNKIEASKLKRTGLLAGIPDLIVLMPNKQIVFIEMKKRTGGKISPIQKTIIKIIEKLGFTVLIGYGFLDIKDKFEQYLKNL